MIDLNIGKTFTYTTVLIFTYLLFKFQVHKKRLPTSKSRTGLYSVKLVESGFNWETQSPLKLFPFKNAEYKLTMGIKNLDVQDWLLMESCYLDKVTEKKSIVTNNHKFYPKDKNLPDRTVFITDECIPAIREFYDIVVNYMCDKYPMNFVRNKAEGVIFNRATGENVPISSEEVDVEDTRDLLIKLTGTIEEDFIILLKDPTKHDEVDGEEYFFKGGVFAFAAGFNPADRFNKPLSFIHHPIPGYESKLKLSMNRFFNRISPGSFVTRSNFSVQTHDQHYVDDKNKGHNTPNEDIVPLKMEDLDFDNQVHYRSERQVLTKLPVSGAVVFTIRTYLLPMSQLKAEGREVSERFIGAINGLPKEIAEYKRSVEWGPALIEYLGQ